MNDTEPLANNEEATPEGPESIECHGSREHAVRIFILAGMCLIGGLWSLYDLFFGSKYPYASFSEDSEKNKYKPFRKIWIGISDYFIDKDDNPTI